MSRLGKKPLTIPEKVKIELKGNQLEISGPLGKVVRIVPAGLNIKVTGNEVLVEKIGNERQDEMNHGLYRAVVNNMMTGVTKGYKKDIIIEGLGYKAIVEGKNLMLTLGFSGPKTFPIPDGIKITVEKLTNISITGTDNILVGDVAARMRRMRPPEPYKGTGVRYVGEHIIRKAGKAAAGAAGGK